MNCPKISIIIPCYNAEKYLPKCLDSVMNQTYKNLEIICINDGSPDSSIDILNDYKAKDNRIIVISQDNKGLSAARNTGAKYVSGDYLMYLDSDDWLSLDTCEKSVTAAIDNNADLVIWSYVKEFSGKQELKYVFDKKEIIFDEKACKDSIHRRIVGLYENELSIPENADSLVTAWGKLYKTNIIIENNIQFVDTSLIGTEDALFNIYALGYIKKAVYIPDCLYHYRKDNQTSLTSNYKEKLFSQWQYLFDLIEDYISSESLDEPYTAALNNRICLSIIGLGLNIMSADKSVNKVKEIKKIIASKRYRNAYKRLTLKYFPIHWKVFFAFAKYNFAFGVFLMLKAIKFLIGK